MLVEKPKETSMSSKKHQRSLKEKRDRELYFEEEYLVRFVTGKSVFVYVKVENGVNEKCNHQEDNNPNHLSPPILLCSGCIWFLQLPL
jgi:hypothetical protein